MSILNAEFPEINYVGSRLSWFYFETKLDFRSLKRISTHIAGVAILAHVKDFILGYEEVNKTQISDIEMVKY